MKYSSIKLGKGFENYESEEGKPVYEINRLSTINIFVGANNSGKSRFLRELIKIKNIEFKPDGFDFSFLKQEINFFKENIKEILNKSPNIVTFYTGEIKEITAASFEISPPAYFSENDDAEQKKLKSFYDILKSLTLGGYRVAQYKGSSDISLLQYNLHKFLNENKERIENINHFIINIQKKKKIYIPILRSLNNLGQKYIDGEIDFYKERISKIYGLNESDHNLEIFTGMHLYREVRNMLLGDQKEREKIKSYELFLSTELFNKRDVSLIPREGSDVLHVKIGKEEFPIYDLGDGIQSLIILTFPLFKEDDALFFIEEPEIHLHPTLQRKVLEIFKKKTRHQYFLSTHSNHFLDLTLWSIDISVYSFKKKDEKIIMRLVDPGDDYSLRLLGARNSSLFLSNCTIWVEGITDRLYIRKFLELYQKDNPIKIQEDIDYSFVEYGGDNITHWSFLDYEENPINVDRLCGKSFLITDNDGQRKLERKDLLKQKLGNRYKLLECREIENILSLKTLERVIKDYEKDDNFKVPSFGKSQYPHKNKKLGEFIEKELFLSNKFTRKGGYKESSGTIKDKLNFCKKAIEHLDEDGMSSLAKDLAEQIYNFVLNQKEPTE